jgi:hypothetical protein
VSSETDEGYVHHPDESSSVTGSDSGSASAPDDAVERTTAGPDTDGDAPVGARLPGPEPTGFGDRGWVLVATVVLAFLVIPGIIYLRPALPGEAGLSFIVAMLVLPLIPAVLLGLTAVWSMRESRRR